LSRQCHVNISIVQYSLQTFRRYIAQYWGIGAEGNDLSGLWYLISQEVKSEDYPS